MAISDLSFSCLEASIDSFTVIRVAAHISDAACDRGLLSSIFRGLKSETTRGTTRPVEESVVDNSGGSSCS